MVRSKTHHSKPVAEASDNRLIAALPRRSQSTLLASCEQVDLRFEAVQRTHLGAALHQGSGQVGADEPGAAGDEHSFAHRHSSVAGTWVRDRRFPPLPRSPG